MLPALPKYMLLFLPTELLDQLEAFAPSGPTASDVF